MKNLNETRLLLYSFGLLISSALERIITLIADDRLHLMEQNVVLYHIFSLVLLTVLFVFTNISIKSVTNQSWVSKKVFGKKYVGGRWLEITWHILSDTEEEIDHYCDLQIGYDTDKIYLSGTDYGRDYKFWYNLETESSEMENYSISYIYRAVGNNEIRKGYGSLEFHKKSTQSPDRYSGKYNNGNNGDYRVEGFLINDKRIIRQLDKNFIPTFKALIEEKIKLLEETQGSGQAAPDWESTGPYPIKGDSNDKKNAVCAGTL